MTARPIQPDSDTHDVGRIATSAPQLATPFKPAVKARPDEQSATMTEDQSRAVCALANDLHRLNASMIRAVEAAST